jgi:RimJ/RimL family protein N-acetyltransferase
LIVEREHGAEAEVTIRRMREGDARLFYQWTAIPELQRYQPLYPWPVGAIRKRIRHMSQSSLEEDRGHMVRWIIELDGTAAGWVTLNNILWEHRSATLGYSVIPWAQRQGVGFRGVSQVLDIAFTSARLRRVEANCDIDNVESQGLLDKLGFQREGLLRSLVQMPGGGRRDYYLYSILSDEWKSLR